MHFYTYWVGGRFGSVQLTCTTDSIAQGLHILPQGHGVFSPCTRSLRQCLSVRKAASSSGVVLPMYMPKEKYISKLASLAD